MRPARSEEWTLTRRSGSLEIHRQLTFPVFQIAKNKSELDLERQMPDNLFEVITKSSLARIHASGRRSREQRVRVTNSSFT
jgi:hypothetical protein